MLEKEEEEEDDSRSSGSLAPGQSRPVSLTQIPIRWLGRTTMTTVN